MVTAKLITILAGMEVGLKSVVISWTTGLYGLKFAKSSALADDFLTLVGSVTAGIRARFSMLLFTSVFKTKRHLKNVISKLKSVPVAISFMPS